MESMVGAGPPPPGHLPDTTCHLGRADGWPHLSGTLPISSKSQSLSRQIVYCILIEMCEKKTMPLLRARHVNAILKSANFIPNIFSPSGFPLILEELGGHRSKSLNWLLLFSFIENSRWPFLPEVQDQRNFGNGCRLNLVVVCEIL